jgi:hypothetical protein
MHNVCERTPEVEHEVLAVEPAFDDPREDEKSTSRSARVIALVGAWLVERFANVPGPAFIEDGRLAAYSRDLHSPVATQKVVH